MTLGAPFGPLPEFSNTRVSVITVSRQDSNCATPSILSDGVFFSCIRAFAACVLLGSLIGTSKMASMGAARHSVYGKYFLLMFIRFSAAVLPPIIIFRQTLFSNSFNRNYLCRLSRRDFSCNVGGATVRLEPTVVGNMKR